MESMQVRRQPSRIIESKLRWVVTGKSVQHPPKRDPSGTVRDL